MKKNAIIVFSISLLLLVNTSYFWVKLPVLFDASISFLLFLSFLILIVLFIKQLKKGFNEKFQFKKRNINIVVSLFVLVIIYLFPFGCINFEKIIYGEDILYIQYEGVANGTINLKFKNDNVFIEKSIFFGIDYNQGKYKIKNDTIFLEFNKKSSFNNKNAYCTFDKSNNSYSFYYNNGKHERPLPMKVINGNYSKLKK